MFSLFKRKEEKPKDELTEEEERRINETQRKYRHFSKEYNIKVRNQIRNEIANPTKMSDFGTYVVLCWMRELDVYIDPSFVQNSIFNVFSRRCDGADWHCKDLIKQIRILFTNSIHKKEIRTFLGQPTNPTEIIKEMFQTISEKGLHPTLMEIGNTKFESDVNGDGMLFTQAAILDVGRNFYTYVNSDPICGIKSVKIEGTLSDWMLLKSNILKLSELINSVITYDRDRNFKEYLVKCLEIIDDIIKALTEPSEETDKWLMEGITNKGKGYEQCGKFHNVGSGCGAGGYFDGFYYFPDLCGWLVYLTYGKDTRSIMDMTMKHQMLPFKQIEKDDSISYYCIYSCIQFTEGAVGKNWGYNFELKKIDERDYQYLAKEYMFIDN